MEKSCSECSEPTLAQSLCTLCNKWLCYQCTDVHQHQKASATSKCTDMRANPRTGAAQGPDLHPRGSSSLLTTGPGPGSYPCSLLMCHAHRQEPLELFCESCDLLCCSSCHLSSHKNHRVMQIGKALQDQRWLFESLMVQVEERRSAVENSAKQIHDRIHSVKIGHRKAENQIKMAKMIMMNELNKRANLLIEQLEKISEDFQQHLEDQLQGAIEICGQLDHVQKFITWATTHHCRGPVLFSRTLISLQMQQLLESSLPSDSWSPVRIKFNWDASYWTKQISSLGQLTVEGGNCSYPQGLACSTILRPQPVACLALPSVCHRGRESGCGYQTCCEPQMCCLHAVPPQPDQNQLGAVRYNVSCAQPPFLSASLGPSQQLQRCWDAKSTSALDTSSQCPPCSSPALIMGPLQVSCGHGQPSQPQAAASQPQSQSCPHHQHKRDAPPDNHAQGGADPHGPGQKHGQCRGKVTTGASLQQEPRHVAVDQDVMTEENWEETCRVEETRQQTAGIQRTELLDEEPQVDRTGAGPVQWQQLKEEQQGTRDSRTGQRSPSLEVPVTAHECASDAQRRLSPSPACARRTRRSQSIPAELAAPYSSPHAERPAGCARSMDARAVNKADSVDPKQRRASDGVLYDVKETASDTPCTAAHRSSLLSYKTEPDHLFAHLHEDVDYDAGERCSLSRSSHSSSRDVDKDSRRSSRVPVVCLERLKILISQLPPHGRRQSDPLPASTTERSEASMLQRTWKDAAQPKGSADTARTVLCVTESPQTNQYACRQSTAPSICSDGCERLVRHPSAEPQCLTHGHAGLDLASDPRSGPRVVSQVQPDCDPQLDSDVSPDSGPNTASSSEAEPPGRDHVPAGETSLEYDADPESGAGSDGGQGLDAETESDVQPDPGVQVETDSDSDQPLDSHDSAESDLGIESEPDGPTDDPQPLRSDLEEESPVGPGQRPLLIANPQLDDTEMESEDFCAVCLIGGDLLCCDRCPKVFHLSCHIPSLLSFPLGDWICSLCRDVVDPEVEYDCENARTSGERTGTPGLSACDQRKCERLTLLILSNMLSAPFHEPVSPLARHYYQIIKRPMDLSVVRAKLNKKHTPHYNSPDQFVADVYLMFHNCAKFNYPDSEVAQAGRSLETFFASKLLEVFPGRVFSAAEVDSDSDEYDESYRGTESGFPWPERREHCHRKRKRRNSLKSRRHHF